MLQVIKGNIVDVYKEKIYKGEVHIKDKIIVNIKEKEVPENHYILPGLIDAHMHIESTMVTPSRFSQIAIKHGTVAVVTDPHEIANVKGIEGIDYMIDDSKSVPMKFFFGAPSCVPATNFETSGAEINSTDIENLLKRDDIFFLSEMMNYPGVIFNDKEVHKKLKLAKKYNKRIDGHAPGIYGDKITKYINAGITTDHECLNTAEAIDKINKGMLVQIREGSAAKNFEALHTLIDTHPNSIMLCTDDSHPDDLINLGHIDKIVRIALNKNHNIFNILKATVLNPIKHYNLPVGSLKVNDFADLIIVDNLNEFNILKTYINGECVFENNKIKFSLKPTNKTINNFKLEKTSIYDLKIKTEKKSEIKVITFKDGDLMTNYFTHKINSENKFIESDLENDILKIVVINRYNKKSKPVIGFINNFNIKNGAIASSIAHDSHNIIAVGSNDKDIHNAINKIIENKGGISVSSGEYLDSLELEIGGLMTNKDIYTTSKKYTELDNKTKEIGSKLNSPFMTLSFMALLVIPKLKIGDKGLFDGEKFELTTL